MFSFGTPSSSSQPQSSTPAFSFGTPAPASSGATSQPQSSFSFGAPAQKSTSSPSLFGQPQQQQQQNPSGTGGLFGQSQGQQSGGLFGQSQPQQGGLFGQSQPQSQPQQQQSGLFGQSQPQQQQGGLFGQQQQQQQQGSLFGGGQQSSLFGGKPQSSLFGSAQPQQQPPQQQQQPSLSQSVMAAPSATDDLSTKLQRVQSAWDTSSPHCAFKTYVYNVADPQTAQWIKQHNNGQPPRTQADADEELWVKAGKENPDRERMLPTLLVGHEALSERVRLQEEMAARHEAKLDECTTQLRELNTKHTLDTSLRLSRARHAQAVLSARLIHLVARLHQLTPIRGTPLRAEEDRLSSTLSTLSQSIGARGDLSSSSSSSSSLQDAINELWVLTAQRKARRSQAGGGGHAEKEEWAVSNEGEALKVLGVLAQQHRTLEYLTNVVQGDAKAVDVVREGFGEGPVAQALGDAQ